LNFEPEASPLTNLHYLTFYIPVKKSEKILWCHSRENGNPGWSSTYVFTGYPCSRVWQLFYESVIY